MLIKRDLTFTPNGKNRPLHIWVPDDFQTSGERYPVMYFFDGHNLFLDSDATYGRSWRLSEFLNGWDKKMIVVGIECGHEGNERLREYTPYRMDSRFLGHYDGTGDETLCFMVQELKPMIDRDFPTWPHREATGICGSSMGGLMSLYAAVKYNEVFGKAACLSSAVGGVMKELQRDIAAGTPDADTRIYLSLGEMEGGGSGSRWMRENMKLQRLLDAKGVITKLELQPQGRHTEADWEKLIPSFMRFLWQE